MFTLNSYAGFSEQLKVVENTDNSMNARWQALMSATQMASDEQLMAIKQLAKSNEWYIRNAVMVALKDRSQSLALEVARQLVTDKALVVRSAAVDILAQDWSDEVKNIFVTEVNKPYNFNKQSSLWIRKQMVEKISEKSSFLDKEFFEKMSQDSDKEIAQMSRSVLEKISNKATKTASASDLQ
jgi:HEAT repeat protein